MKLRTTIATAIAAAVLSTAGVSLAGAATGSSTASSTPAVSSSIASSSATQITQLVDARFRWILRRLAERNLLRGAAKVVIQTIGIDRATLVQGLRSGQTIADIANANQGTPQTVIDALVAAGTAKLEAAAANHKITTARAHAIEAKLPRLVGAFVNEWHLRR